MTDPILFPYTSADARPALESLRAQHRAVVTLTLDVGQGGDLVAVRESALAAGALRAHVIDVKDEFAHAFLFAAIQTGALHAAPLCARGVATAVLARHLAELARMERVRTVACAGEAGDVHRLDVSIRSCDPRITTIPVPLPLASGSGRTGRVEATVWGRTILADVPEGAPWGQRLTRDPADCPDEAALVEIEFERGVPVRANGVEMPLLELIDSLEIIGGAHGVGRIAPEDPAAGICEAPAAVVLHEAHHGLASAVIDPELRPLKRQAAETLLRLLDEGRFFSPAREAIDAFFSALQRRVSGSVQLELFKGRTRSVAVRPHAALAEPAGGAAIERPRAVSLGAGRPA